MDLLISGAKNPKQDRAAQFYVQCGCKVQARNEAGYPKSKNESALADKLFREPSMIQAVQYYSAIAAKIIDVRGETILREIAALSFSNMGDYIDCLAACSEDSDSKDFYGALSKLPREKTAAIQSLKVTKTYNAATEEITFTSEIKLHNKWAPLKHIADIAVKLKPDETGQRGVKKVNVNWRKSKEETQQ